MWTPDEDQPERWRRVDGATVRRTEQAAMKGYSAYDRTGCVLQQYFRGRKPMRKTYRTPEQAMGAADRHWPLKHQQRDQP